MSKQMSWKDAVIKVLGESTEPVHYKNIAEEIEKRGYRHQLGATPAQSVNAAIAVSFKTEGDASPFERVKAGHYRLRATAIRQVAEQAETVSVATIDSSGEEVAETGGIIHAFGMFWRRDFVYWKANPSLAGQQQHGAISVDFAGQYGVYLLHDGREVIYVGRAIESQLASRLAAHTKDRLNGRWDRFSWFGLLPVNEDGKLVPLSGSVLQVTSEQIIVTLEALLIEGIEPRQNRKKGDGFAAIEYQQVKDPSIVKVERKRLIESLIAQAEPPGQV